MAAAPRHHRRCEQAGEHDRRAQVDVERAVDLVGHDIEQRGRRPAGRRWRRARRRPRPRATSRSTSSGRRGRRRTARAPSSAASGSSTSARRPVRTSRRRRGAASAPRDGLADAAGRAREQDGLAGDVHRREDCHRRGEAVQEALDADRPDLARGEEARRRRAGEAAAPARRRRGRARRTSRCPRPLQREEQRSRRADGRRAPRMRSASARVEIAVRRRGVAGVQADDLAGPDRGADRDRARVGVGPEQAADEEVAGPVGGGPVVGPAAVDGIPRSRPLPIIARSASSSASITSRRRSSAGTPAELPDDVAVGGGDRQLRADRSGALGDARAACRRRRGAGRPRHRSTTRSPRKSAAVPSPRAGAGDAAQHGQPGGPRAPGRAAAGRSGTSPDRRAGSPRWPPRGPGTRRSTGRRATRRPRGLGVEGRRTRRRPRPPRRSPPSRPRPRVRRRSRRRRRSRSARPAASASWTPSRVASGAARWLPEANTTARSGAGAVEPVAGRGGGLDRPDARIRVGGQTGADADVHAFGRYSAGAADPRVRHLRPDRGRQDGRGARAGRRPARRRGGSGRRLGRRAAGLRRARHADRGGHAGRAARASSTGWSASCR